MSGDVRSDSGELTAERLRSLISYDPDTGNFIWLVAHRGIVVGSEAGSLDRDGGYIQIGVDHRLYRAHRLAWLYMTGDWPIEVDHKNGNRADNRWDNLREATRSQNNANGKRRADNTSGHKGISWDSRRGRWHAYININSKRRNLGCFREIESAIAARASAETSIFGEFARA